MPRFRYTAIDTAGKRSNGVLEATNPAAIAERLHAQSHLLLRADEVGKRGRLWELLQGEITIQRSLTKVAVAQFTRELSVMLQADQISGSRSVEGGSMVAILICNTQFRLSSPGRPCGLLEQATSSVCRL